MSPELVTLTQLLDGDLTLDTVRGHFPDDETFRRAVLILLKGGDVKLLDRNDRWVPDWRLAEVFGVCTLDPVDRTEFRLAITEAGMARVG